MTPGAGIRLTVPHWYGFAPGVATSRSAVLTDEEWDRLRESDAAFGFGASREEWMSKARSNTRLVERARAMARLLESGGATHLVSVGVGTGLFEFLLKSEMPHLALRCGDWSPESLRLLRERFQECESIERMDLRLPIWARDPDEVVLLNRVDMELTDAEWRRVFRQLAGAGTRRILLVPCGLLNGNSFMSEIRALLVSVRERRQIARSGFLRTQGRLLDLLADSYVRRDILTAGDLPTWILDRREGAGPSATH
jgi:hypothetical protein